MFRGSRIALGLIVVTAAGMGLTICGAGEITVTYVANEGFLLASGGHKVLVDALFDAGLAGCARIPDSLRAKLERAEPPFDGVDFVLTTHHHADHFGPVAVSRHLRANPEARFVSTPRAVQQVLAELGADDSAPPQIEAVLPEEGARIERSHGGVRIAVLNLHHGRGRKPPVDNLGFLIDSASYFAPDRSYEKHLEAMRRTFPDVIVLAEPGSSKVVRTEE